MLVGGVEAGGLEEDGVGGAFDEGVDGGGEWRVAGLRRVGHGSVLGPLYLIENWTGFAGLVGGLSLKEEELMAGMIEAIHVKRKTMFEFEGAPYACLDSDISTPTARGGQTLVRLKMRNLLTGAVFEKTFKAQERFNEPDLELVPATYLYSDPVGSYFLNQENFETLTLSGRCWPMRWIT